jgi:hypothetical protein
VGAVKRMLVCAAWVVTLALPTTTAAGTRSFHGTVDPDGTVDFRAKIRHGKPVKVRGSLNHPGFAWNGFPIECDLGTFPGDVVSGNFTFSIRVEDREFHGKGSNGTATAKVRGRFRKHGTKAKGILRVHGDFPPLDASGCDTGKGVWSAHRVPY